MAAVRIDDSRFPVVVVTFPGSYSDPEFEDYLERMTRLLERKKKNVTILDARQASTTTAKQRAKQATWIKAHDALLKEFSCGSAFVIESALVRGALTAILWLQPMPVQHAVVPTMEAAEQWALRRLIEAGVPLPVARTKASA
jgi:hypothetical protein